MPGQVPPPAAAAELVFVHGSGAGPEAWHLQTRAFPGSRALALPGHRDGGSGRHTVGAYAGWLATQLGGPAIVAGHSLGGAIGLQLALERPELVSALVLIGSGARLRVDPGLLAALDSDPPAAVAELARRSYAPGTHPGTLRKARELLTAVPAQVLHDDFMACDRFDVMERLGEIAAPALVLVGSEDELTPPRYARYLAERLPAGRLIVVPRAGHSAMLEQPRAVNRALAEFLRETGYGGVVQ